MWHLPYMAKRHTEEEGKYNPLLFINSQIYSHEFSTEPGEGEYPISLLLLVLLVPRSIAYWVDILTNLYAEPSYDVTVSSV